MPVKYLSYEGLTKYDELIKNHINNLLEYAVFTDDTDEGDVEDFEEIGGNEG